MKSVFLSVFLFAALLFSNSVFASAGFQNGNQISVVSLQGNVQFKCEDDDGKVPLYSYYNCSGQIATPGTHDYFVTSESVDANKVELSCTQNSGVKTVKKVKFNSAKNKTSSRVNLLTNSLTQRALLDYGVNNVEYKMIKGKDVVSTGTFKVTVNASENRKCKSMSIYSFDSSLCRNQFSGCEHYFRHANYCR